jgi:hypothetical protein
MRKILVLFLIFVSSQAHAQKGFLGKRNQIEWDAFSFINQGKFSFEYKYVLTNQLQLTLIYKYCDLSNPVLLRSIYYTAYDPARSYSDNFRTDAKGTFQYNANTFGIGIVYASSYTNMPMPFGYYTGLAYERTEGTYTEMLNPTGPPSYNFYSSSRNPFDGAFKLNYQCNSNLIKVTYGKCSYLGHNLSLDLSLDMGVIFGRFYGQDSLSKYIAPAELPDNTNILGFVRKTGFSESKKPYEAVSQTDPVYFSYFRFYAMPKIKIGFLF